MDFLQNQVTHFDVANIGFTWILVFSSNSCFVGYKYVLKHLPEHERMYFLSDVLHFAVC